MSKVSVIVAVYNVEDYLPECIDSILTQTFSDLEIILLDDGSTDNSGIICEEYAKKDSRIKVILQINQGLSMARNNGVKAATSQYVMFVDGDDFLEPDYCRVPLELAIKNNADIVCFGIQRFPKEYIDEQQDCEYNRVIDTKEAFFLLAAGVLNDAMCNRLFKRTLFDHVEFPRGKYYEDVATFYRLLTAADRIYITDQILYNYRIRPGSITRTKNPQMSADHREMHALRSRALIETMYDDPEYFNDPRILQFLFRFIVEGNDSEELIQKAEKLIDILRKDTSALTSRQKVLFPLYLYTRPLFEIVCERMGKRG